MDGNYVGRSHQLLTKSKPYYEFLAKKYGTLGRYWDAYGYDPAKLPSKKEFMTQMVKAIKKGNQKHSTLSLLGIAASGMPGGPSFTDNINDIMSEGRALPDQIPPECESEVGFHIAEPTNFLVKSATGAAIPVRLVYNKAVNKQLDSFHNNAEAWILAQPESDLVQRGDGSVTKYADVNITVPGGVISSYAGFGKITRDTDGRVEYCLIGRSNPRIDGSTVDIVSTTKVDSGYAVRKETVPAE